MLFQVMILWRNLTWKFFCIVKFLRSKTPRLSYIKAMDVWQSGCLIFVFAAFIEFALVNVLQRRPGAYRTGRLWQQPMQMLKRRSQVISKFLRLDVQPCWVRFRICGMEMVVCFVKVSCVIDMPLHTLLWMLDVLIFSQHFITQHTFLVAMNIFPGRYITVGWQTRPGTWSFARHSIIAFQAAR